MWSDGPHILDISTEYCICIDAGCVADGSSGKLSCTEYPTLTVSHRAGVQSCPFRTSLNYCRRVVEVPRGIEYPWLITSCLSFSQTRCDHVDNKP